MTYYAVIGSTYDSLAMSQVEAWIKRLPRQRQALFCRPPDPPAGLMTIIMLPSAAAGKGQLHEHDISCLRASFKGLLESFKLEDGSAAFRWVGMAY